MRANRISVGMAVLGAAVSFQAPAQVLEVGLVKMLAGDVSYQSGDIAPGKAEMFMKVRQGDRFSVPAGAQLRVLYFHGGREETWKGPGIFHAGTQHSEPSRGSPAQVCTTGAMVTAEYALYTRSAVAWASSGPTP